MYCGPEDMNKKQRRLNVFKYCFFICFSLPIACEIAPDAGVEPVNQVFVAVTRKAPNKKEIIMFPNISLRFLFRESFKITSHLKLFQVLLHVWGTPGDFRHASGAILNASCGLLATNVFIIFVYIRAATSVQHKTLQCLFSIFRQQFAMTPH